MKHLLLFCISLILSAQNINELPLYGEIKKTPEQIKIDQKFIETSIKLTNGDANKASKYMIRKGWDEIAKQDATTAIKRFNQAYLLNPNDYEIYWGLGIASNIEGKYLVSKKLFLEALKKESKNERLYSDYIFSLINHAGYLGSNNLKDDFKKVLSEALEETNKALKIFPKSSMLFSKRAMIYYYLKDKENTIKDTETSQKLGGSGLDPEFVKAVEKLKN